MRLSPSIALLRTQTDDRLVLLAREGSEPAFAAIVERYRRPLLRMTCRILPESRAEDAVQQAFMAAWKALRRGDEVRELRPWLGRIARNTALNALRVPGYDAEELGDAVSGAPAPQEELERREVVLRTLAGLAALPERQREALLRSAVDGTAHADIARHLGLSEGATRQLVLRARTTLRSAATAITPLPFLHWIGTGAGRGDPTTARIAEMVAGAGSAGAAGMAAKAGVVVALAGGAVAGPTLVEHRAADRAAAQESKAVAQAARASAARASRNVSISATATAAANPSTLAATVVQSGQVERRPVRRRASTGDGGSRDGDHGNDRTTRTRHSDDSGDDHKSSGSSGSGGRDRDDDSSDDVPEVKKPERTRHSGSGDTPDDEPDHSGSGSGDPKPVETPEAPKVDDTPEIPETPEAPDDSEKSGKSGESSGSSGSGGSGSSLPPGPDDND
jgi:RNA polymerase sigma factor (sigma-70 family)